jgi:uncharacterized protein YerC
MPLKYDPAGEYNLLVKQRLQTKQLILDSFRDLFYKTLHISSAISTATISSLKKANLELSTGYPQCLESLWVEICQSLRCDYNTQEHPQII